MNKLNYYVGKYNTNIISVGGGVACNSLLRETLKKTNYDVLLTDKQYCNDNAAMIGAYALNLK
jgi:tRNA A37 threonylcarbamoyltransferase TsaD